MVPRAQGVAKYTSVIQTETPTVAYFCIRVRKEVQSSRFFHFLVTPGRVLCVDTLFALRFSLPPVSLPGAARPERRQSR